MVEEGKTEAETVQLAIAPTETIPEPSPPPGLDELYRVHHRDVLRAAWRVTGNPTDAEDVLHTVFLRLLKRNPSPDLRPSPAAYLRTAAVNAALDVVRSRKGRNLPLEDVAGGEATDDRPDAHRVQEDRELGRALRRAVAGLPERAAEMFALKYLEELSNAEIAEALGTSANVVAVTLFRARARVRKEIGKES